MLYPCVPSRQSADFYSGMVIPIEIAVLLDERRAARMLGVSVGALRDSRIGRGALKVPYLKIGRSVRYDQATLRAFLRKCESECREAPPSGSAA